jgi:hypothetical protein
MKKKRTVETEERRRGEKKEGEKKEGLEEERKVCPRPCRDRA